MRKLQKIADDDEPLRDNGKKFPYAKCETAPRMLSRAHLSSPSYMSMQRAIASITLKIYGSEYK